jgi:hypothetical protein
MNTSTTYDAAVMADTPLAYWRFGETSGNPLDSSGNARHLGWVGSEWARNQPSLLVGDSNPSAYFPGTGYLASGYAEIASASWMDTIVGVECLIRPTSTDAVIVSRDDESNRDILFGVSGQKIYVTWWTPGAGPFTLTGATVLSTGYIAHVAAILEGGVWKLYVNGVLDGSSAGGQTIRAAPSLMRVGATGYWHANPKFVGYIDEVALYATPPNAARINAHWVSAGSPGPVTDLRMGAQLLQVGVVLDDIQVHLRMGGMVVQVAVATPMNFIKVLSTNDPVSVYYGGQWHTTRPLSS